jgi:hypothetical protein
MTKCFYQAQTFYIKAIYIKNVTEPAHIWKWSTYINYRTILEHYKCQEVLICAAIKNVFNLIICSYFHMQATIEFLINYAFH